MKISIIGAGEIGEHLAGMLSKENSDVIILDSNPEITSRVSSNYDVLAINGNATSISDLQRAKVADADLVIAVTNVDEVNMLACLISKRLGAKKTIARIRNAEYSDVNSPVSPSEIGVDVVISPEKSIASDIFQLIKRAAARDVIPLAGGQLQLIGLRISPGSTLVNKNLEELASSLFNYDFRIAAIQRGVRTILPDGKSKIVKNDNVFVLLHSKDVPDFIEKSGYKKNSLKNIMIAGGGLVGRNVLHHLMNDSEKWNVKLIEPDKEKCISLASKYKKTLVLHGNSNDPNLLASEGIMDMDIFISVTQDEESNIVNCLLAKHLGVNKTISLVSKPTYIPLSQTIGLDSAVNMKLSTAMSIHQYILKGDIFSISTLYGLSAELLELGISATSSCVNKPIKKLKLPEGCVIGATIQNGVAEIATGETILQADDHLLVFSFLDNVVNVTDYFQ